MITCLKCKAVYEDQRAERNCTIGHAYPTACPTCHHKFYPVASPGDVFGQKTCQECRFNFFGWSAECPICRGPVKIDMWQGNPDH